MIYTILKPLVRFFTLLYFRRVRINGIENIDTSKPAFIVINHSNAFLESVLLAVIYPIKPYFLARGDVFNTPLKRKFFRLIQMLPIYRQRDGYDSPTRNDETFNAVEKILANGGHVIIFPEGDCFPEKRLRPFKKGTARMSFQTYMNSNVHDLQIIPIGINYTDFGAPDCDVYIEVGQPVMVDQFKEIMKTDYAKGLLEFNKVVSAELEKVVVNISDTETYTHQNEHARVKREMQIGKAMVDGITKSPELSDERAFIQEAPTFSEVSLSNAQLSAKGIKESGKDAGILKAIRFEIALLKPLFALPHALAHNITKGKVKKLEFFSSLEMAFRMVFVSLWIYLLALVPLFFIDYKLYIYFIIVFVLHMLYRFLRMNEYKAEVMKHL